MKIMLRVLCFVCAVADVASGARFLDQFGEEGSAVTAMKEGLQEMFPLYFPAGMPMDKRVLRKLYEATNGPFVGRSSDRAGVGASATPAYQRFYTPGEEEAARFFRNATESQLLGEPRDPLLATAPGSVAGQRALLPNMISPDLCMSTYQSLLNRYSAVISSETETETPVSLSDLDTRLVATVLSRVRKAMNISSSSPLSFLAAQLIWRHNTQPGFPAHVDNSIWSPKHQVRVPVPWHMFSAYTVDISLSDPKLYSGGHLTFVHPDPMASPQYPAPQRCSGITFGSGVRNAHRISPVTQGWRIKLVVWLHTEPFPHGSSAGQMLQKAIASEDVDSVRKFFETAGSFYK